MSILETILVATLVNGAASFVFFAIQPRLEELRSRKPRLVNLIGPVLLGMAVAIVLFAQRVAVMPSGTVIHIHIPTIAATALEIQPTLSIWASAGLAVTIVGGAVFQSLADRWRIERNITEYMTSLLSNEVTTFEQWQKSHVDRERAKDQRRVVARRPAEVASIVTLAVLGYKVLAYTRPMVNVWLILVIVVLNSVSWWLVERDREYRIAMAPVFGTALSLVMTTLVFWF